MLGSDYPFPLGEAEPGMLIESMDLDEAVKATLLHGTALEWLGLNSYEVTELQSYEVGNRNCDRT